MSGVTFEKWMLKIEIILSCETNRKGIGLNHWDILLTLKDRDIWYISIYLILFWHLTMTFGVVAWGILANIFPLHRDSLARSPLLWDTPLICAKIKGNDLSTFVLRINCCHLGDCLPQSIHQLLVGNYRSIISELNPKPTNNNVHRSAIEIAMRHV